MHDVDAHEAWKRGAATARQDRGEVVAVVVEPSEELRLKLLKLVASLAEALLARGNSQMLHPYFHDLVLFLQVSQHSPTITHHETSSCVDCLCV